MIKSKTIKKSKIFQNMNKKNIKTKINRQKYNHGSKKVMSGGNICALFGKQIDNSDNPLDLSESDFKIINKQ